MIWLDSFMAGIGMPPDPQLKAMLSLQWILIAVMAGGAAFETWVLWQLLHSGEAWLRYGCGCGTLLRMVSTASALVGVGQQEEMQKLESLGSWAGPVYYLVCILYLGYTRGCSR